MYYMLWKSIKQRCFDKTNLAYGGRGITMYPEWVNSYESFESWILANLGERPDGMTLDRRDNDGNYEPGNLRWATRKMQVDNRRNPVVITNTGESHISKQSNGRYSIAKPGGNRVQNIGSLQEALTIRNQLWNLNV